MANPNISKERIKSSGVTVEFSPQLGMDFELGDSKMTFSGIVVNSIILADNYYVSL